MRPIRGEHEVDDLAPLRERTPLPVRLTRDTVAESLTGCSAVRVIR